MGGRGASIKKSKTIKQKQKVAKVANKSKVQKKPKRFLFNRMAENKKMGDLDYRKANIPRGAKSFLSMLQRNNTGSAMDLFEPYTIAKWAYQSGYKSLDKKSSADIKKILNEYAKTQNIHLKAAIESKHWHW